MRLEIPVPNLWLGVASKHPAFAWEEAQAFFLGGEEAMLRSATAVDCAEPLGVTCAEAPASLLRKGEALPTSATAINSAELRTIT